MSKRPKIILTSEDLFFMQEYLEKKHILKSEFAKIDPPYKEYDAEISFSKELLKKDERYEELKDSIPETTGKITYRFKDIGVHLHEGVLTKQARIVLDFENSNKTKDTCSFTLCYSVAETFEDLFESEKEKYEAEKKMLEFMQVSSEKAEDIIRKGCEERLPALQIGVLECSRDMQKHKIINNYINLFMICHSAISLFLAYFKPEVVKVASTRTTANSTPTKTVHKKKKQKQKPCTTTVIQMSKFVTDFKEGKVKLPRRKCPYAFQVRGHFRVYKSGKKVWIKEFTKNSKNKKKKQTIVLQKDKGNFLERI